MMRLETQQPRFSMFERINQALRHIQRQHKSKAIGAGTALGGSALAAGLLGAGIVTGPASIVFLVPVYAGVMMGALGGDPSRVRENEYTLNGFKLVGAPRDLTRIKAMQEYINKKTEKMQHLGTLPEKLQQAINQHIADVAPVLQRLRVYKSYAWKEEEKGELSSFEFKRSFIDEKGSKTEQVLARIELVPMGLLPRQEPARLVIEQIPANGAPALPAPEALRGEFKALSEKVEGVVGQVEQVADRVDALEKPQSAAPARLDKPKFGSR